VDRLPPMRKKAKSKIRQRSRRELTSADDGQDQWGGLAAADPRLRQRRGERAPASSGTGG
jgi:hypothetical protein